VVLQQGAQIGDQLVMRTAGEVAQKILGITAVGRYLLGLRQAYALARLARGQGVLSALERQRWQMALVEAEYLADEDHVITALIHEGGAALEARGTVVQQRDIVDAAVQLDTGELVLAAGGEAPGELLLLHRQHMDVPVLGVGEGVQA